MSNRSTPGPRAKGPTHHAAAAPARENTLGMNSHELEAIYAQLDSGAGDPSHKRQSARLAFHVTSIGVEIIQPGGGQTQMKVACRNLSRTGLGFLHSSYIHIGTKVVIALTHHAGAPERVPARVVRCRHVTRHIHDVGVIFNEPINVRDFMALDPLNQTFTCEVVDPAHLKGTLLVVAEYKIEQCCVESMLRDTSLDFLAASTVEDGLKQARKGVGVILCDDVFEVASGVDFVVAARKCGVRSPIILMSADTTERGLDRMRKADADAFLAKPIKQDLLLRAVAEFLLMGGEKADMSAPMYPTLPADSPMLDLADSFVDDLKAVANRIENFAATDDIASIRRQCLRIGGPATSLGFEPIAKLSTALINALDSTRSLDHSVVALNTLISACRGARKAARRAEKGIDELPDDIFKDAA